MVRFSEDMKANGPTVRLKIQQFHGCVTIQYRVRRETARQIIRRCYNYSFTFITALLGWITGATLYHV